MAMLRTWFRDMKARSWLFALLVGTYMVMRLSARISNYSMVFAVAPFAIILLIVQLAKKQIQWSAYSINLFAMAAFYALAWVRNLDLSSTALYPLVLSCVSMTVIGIFPKDYPQKTLHAEFQIVSILVLALMVPLSIVGFASVFANRPLPFLGKSVGVTGGYSSRLSLLAHPNPTSTLCAIAIMFAIYWLDKHPSRWVKVVLGCAIVPLVLAIVHCQSRSDYIALAAAIGALVFRYLYLRGFQGIKRIWAALAAWGIVFFALLWLFNGIYRVDIRIAKSLLEEPTSGNTVSHVVTEGTFNMFSNGRDGIWINGIRYLLNHPSKLLLGMGSGEIMTAIKAEMPEMWPDAGHLHNALLETLARGGIPMLLSALAMLVMLVKPCLTLLVAPETEEHRGEHIFMIIIGMLLMLSVVEVGLFCYAHLSNIIFFYASGRVMNAYSPALAPDLRNIR